MPFAHPRGQESTAGEIAGAYERVCPQCLYVRALRRALVARAITRTNGRFGAHRASESASSAIPVDAFFACAPCSAASLHFAKYRGSSALRQR